MTGDARMFNSINTNNSNGYYSITFGDNGKGKVKGLGKIAISNDLSISNVLLVESLNFHLLSVAQVCDLGFKCVFGVDDVEIISVDGSNLIFKGFRYKNQYLVDLMLVKLNCQHACSLSLVWIGYGIEGLVKLE
jgi:hypothetical protein